MSDKRVFWIALATSVAVLAVFQIGKTALCCAFRGCPPPQCRKMCPMKDKQMGPQKRECTRPELQKGPERENRHNFQGKGPRFFVQCPQCQAMIDLQEGLRNGPRMQRMGRHGRRMQEGRETMLRPDRKGAMERNGKDQKAPKDRKERKDRKTPGKNGFRPGMPGEDLMPLGEGPIMPPPMPPKEKKADKAGEKPAPKAEVKAPAVKSETKAEVKPAK